MSTHPDTPSGRVAVLAPSPVLTVMIERHEGGEPEIHLHAGGQGFWVARMSAILGAHVTFCAPLGGETGILLHSLLKSPGFKLRAVCTAAPNGAYVQERGERERHYLAETRSPALTRHEADELYGSVLAAALASDVCVLTGSRHEGVLEPDFYRRLAADLRENGRTVAADLSGDELAAALRGGIDILHLDARELGEHTGISPRGTADCLHGASQLRDEGAANVIVSRGPEPVIALLEDRALELRGPRLEPRDHGLGAGDTMFATIVAAAAEGTELEIALRRGVAAGALNATRRGFGTGSPHDIQTLAETVTITPLSTKGMPGSVR